MKFTANDPVVTDGPFAGTKELIAGFWIWQVKSMDDAVEWLKRSPFGDGASKFASSTNRKILHRSAGT